MVVPFGAGRAVDTLSKKNADLVAPLLEGNRAA
jgi:hypothetical protein